MTAPSRPGLVQGPPRANLDLTGFPTEDVGIDNDLYRAHRKGLEPWYFDNTPGDDGGRFNLTGARGTCYAADTAEIALRERFGRRLVELGEVDLETASSTVVSEIAPEPRVCAVVSTTAAARYGITTELCDGGSYEIGQAWASRFDEEPDLEGVRYTSRFSGGGQANAWALFGPAGAHAEYIVSEDPIEGVAACDAAGITVTPPPQPDEVTLLRLEPLKEVPDEDE